MAALRCGRGLISARRTQRTAQSFFSFFPDVEKKRDAPCPTSITLPGILSKIKKKRNPSSRVRWRAKTAPKEVKSLVKIAQLPINLNE